MNQENKKLTSCRECGAEIAKNAKTCPQCGGKVKKPIYKKWWFVTIIIVVLIAAISAASGTKPQNNAPETDSAGNEPQEQQVVEYTSYTVSDLINDLDNNALSAEKKYHNQYVKISGKLSNIDSDGAYISLSPTNGTFTFTNVQCFIQNDEQRDYVATLSKDHIVTLKGKITSVGEVMGYHLNIDEFVTE